MCYYNGQKVTRAEFIKLKSLEKAVSKYNFLNVGVHNGFNYAPCAILIPSEDGKDFRYRPGGMGLCPRLYQNACGSQYLPGEIHDS